MDIQHAFTEYISTLEGSPAKQGVLRNVQLKKDFTYIRVEDKMVYFMDHAGAGFNEKSTDVLVNKIKLLIKKSPWLFSTIYRLMVPATGKKSTRDIIANTPKGGVVLNLGSGVTNLRPDIINIDFYPFENVDLVADIANLPFADSSVDTIISECVLEHVQDPRKVIAEMSRVLKPGGSVFVIVPFVFSFHSSPHDYRRWTKMGLQEEFRDFDHVDSGVYFGPGNAINWVLAEYIAILFSFGWKKLHQLLFMIFLILFVPLCYLDFIINRFETSENIASHVYYLGKKI